MLLYSLRQKQTNNSFEDEAIKSGDDVLGPSICTQVVIVPSVTLDKVSPSTTSSNPGLNQIIPWVSNESDNISQLNLSIIHR